MRFFPVAVEVEGRIYDPALVLTDDDGGAVWAIVDGAPTAVLTISGTVTRLRQKGALSNGARVVQVLTFDNNELPLGKSKLCTCNSGSHPLRHFEPQPA